MYSTYNSVMMGSDNIWRIWANSFSHPFSHFVINI